jgi:choline dehydrogenase-like flavoprotein
MLIDARSVPTGTVIETEVCIVGAGAAGITLAREFISSGFRVALLESGDTVLQKATQELYAGSNIGRRYYDPKDTNLRLRYFGGTTNVWGGLCPVLDPLDFEIREGVKYSGWPFSRTYLEPWYQRAQAVVQLGPSGYALSDWGIAPADVPEPFNGPHFICQVMQLSSPPTRFAPVYESELRQASRLTVYLNANALHFDTSDSDNNVEQLSVGVLPDGRFTIRARIYVLATGGIENARLLQLSGKDGGNGLGNDHDLVGRFFMCHIEYEGGVVALANPDMDFKFYTGVGGASYNRFGIPRMFQSYVCLSEDSRRKLELPNLRIRFMKPSNDWTSQLGDVLEDLRSVMRDVFAKPDGTNQRGDVARDLRSAIHDIYEVTASIERKVRFGEGALLLLCTSEQMPNPDSRIELGRETDAFGLRKVAIDWQPTTQDKRGAAAGLRLFGAELGRVGFGRFWSSMPDGDTNWPNRMYGDVHNIGTTRMHRDPRSGVVDENCRVHGVGNLYVAGSSVFPTEGIANSTFTIVALALRLADHIKGRLA